MKGRGDTKGFDNKSTTSASGFELTSDT